MIAYLKTLGGLSLTGDSLPSSASQQRRLALLVLLARAGERGLARDKVLAYLWPESASESARHALDQLLYATRRDVGRHAIRSDRFGLRLDPQLVGADCVEFEARVNRGELAGAVELYQGPFLDGIHLGGAAELDRWVEGERMLLEQQYHASLERLARAASEAGETGIAVSWWRRRAAAEPINGRVARCLMEALEAAGDREAALRHARIHASLVRRELETEADPAVTEYAEALRAAPSHPAGSPPAHLPVSGSARESPAAPQATTSSPPEGGRRLLRRGLAAALLLAASAGVLTYRGRQSATTFGEAEPVPATAPRTPSPEAHEIYLRARLAWSRRSAEGLEQAVVLFRNATERDPLYADAHAGLASAYVLLGYLGFLPGAATYPKGKAAALRALELDPALGEAHAALGKVLQWGGRWVEAEDALLRALHHAPNSATSHQWYALLLQLLGRTEEAVHFAARAAELAPLSVQIHNTLGTLLHNAGDPDSALAVFERVVIHEPDTAWVRANPWVLANYARVLALHGRLEEARRFARLAVDAAPGHPRALHALAVSHLDGGDAAGARAVFERAEPGHPQYSVYRTVLEAQLGELDSAFALARRVEEMHLHFLGILVGDPSLRAFRADPRYPALRRELGLPDPVAP